MHALGTALLTCAILGASAISGTAQTIDAKSFSPTPHKGTTADPWPGNAIVKAINSLPAAGGTVSVADGVWLFDSSQYVDRGNFTLAGTSLNAQLVFTTGTLVIGRPSDSDITPIANVKISTVTADSSGADQNALQGIQVWSCTGCELSDSLLVGHANNSVAVYISQGGANGRVLRNKFTSRGAGGSQLQINPLYNTTNAGFLVDSNELDSVNMLLIGMNNTHVTNNNVHDKTLGNFIAIFWAASCQGTSDGLLFDFNTVNALDNNGAVISGIPQDPGCAGTVRNVTVDHNTISSYNGSTISANDYDSGSLLTYSDISQTYNIAITNNTLEDQAGPSTIDVSGGGVSGAVRGAMVSGNTLHNDAGFKNTLGRDARTFGLTIGTNNGCTGSQIRGRRCPTIQILHAPFP